MRVLYFGSFNRDYSRNRVLIKGLKQNGVEVLECRDDAKGLQKFINLFRKHWRMRNDYDVMIVGFPGQEMMFMARLLTRKPIVFDAFTSHYGGYILDRQYYSKNGLRAKYYRFLDKWSCRLANIVLLDTQSHIDFFVSEFNLSRKKFLRVFVGTDADVFYPRNTRSGTSKFLVHFHGHFIPLQGVECIIRAALILRHKNITFQLIGRGQDYSKTRKMYEDYGLNNIVWIDSVKYEELPNYISNADICLGGFGNTSKGQIVSMNKLFEYMACGKAIITGDAPSVREFLENKKTAIFCQRNPEDLAQKITMLLEDPLLRSSLGVNVRKSFLEKYTPKIVWSELVRSLQNRYN